MQRKVKGRVMVTLQGSWDSSPSAALQGSGHHVAQPHVASEAKGRGFQCLEIPLHAWSLDGAFAQSVCPGWLWNDREETKGTGWVPPMVVLQPSPLLGYPNFPSTPSTQSRLLPLPSKGCGYWASFHKCILSLCLPPGTLPKPPFLSRSSRTEPRSYLW